MLRKELFSKPLIGIIIFINFIYFISCIYAVNSNDGSSLAAVMSLVNKGSYVIDKYVALTHDTDLTKYKGHYYTDRPPGTATLAAPFFYAGFHAGKRLKHIRKNDQLPIVFALFVPVIMGTLSVLLVFSFSRLLGISYSEYLI